MPLPKQPWSSSFWTEVAASAAANLGAALISEINALKKTRDAVILAHNYMTPEIFHGVGDYVGDSLGPTATGASQPGAGDAPNGGQRNGLRPACAGRRSLAFPRGGALTP